MLELHKRAERITNAEGLTWQHFVRSRFVGQLPDRNRSAAIAVVIQTAAQQSDTHGELRGILEFSANQSLPVAIDFIASIDLETREITIHGSNESQYSGQFAANGRVLKLCGHEKGETSSNPFHLVHEDTLAQLTGAEESASSDVRRLK